ncbi:FAD/NAD(P)-binding domain-containing protein [Phlebopus sp. FC_14]|nr:FAD/NAD(P)-binding domain-containing protein [Phlebopus sp. FC_14]
MADETDLPTLDRLGVDPNDITDISASSIAAPWFTSFSNTVHATDVPGIAALFTPDSSWKDVLALTWDLRTLVGKPAMTRMLDVRLASSQLTLLALHGDDSDAPLRGPVVQRLWPDLVFVRLCFAFKTKAGRGTGVAYLVPQPRRAQWKAYSVFTCLESLDGFPEMIGALRYSTPNHGTWLADRERERDFPNHDPTVVILGGGHTGLEIAARLKYIGVRALVIEKKPRVGDSWRDRYKSLCLHGTTWYNQTPYLPFPCTWPTYMPAPKLADWLEAYAHLLDLNVWTSSTITKTAWDDDKKTWTIHVDKGPNSDIRVLTAKHLVFATGYGGHPFSPDIPGKDTFKGTIIHSAHFTTAAEYTGKKALVVGACNSGHDISQDFFDHGVDVTMYQRSSNYVISQKAASHILENFKEGYPTDLADLYNASWPMLVARMIHRRKVREVADTVDRELHDGLARAGYKTNLGPYDAGLLPLIYGRTGGYHINTRTSKHIINGDIKLVSGVPIQTFTPEGVRFEDGSVVEADVVVFATGYGDHLDAMRTIYTPRAGTAISPVWNTDDAGQLQGAWRPQCGHDGLWFVMGSLAVSRVFSAYLALQIKALEEGVVERAGGF